MAWLRIDDGFASHPKIAAISDRELRVWLRVLCYCAKTRDPTVDDTTIREVPGLTKRLVSRYENAGLLDAGDNGHEVHDWLVYLPKDATNAERQARWRGKRNGRVTPAVTVKITEDVTDEIPF